MIASLHGLLKIVRQAQIIEIPKIHPNPFPGLGAQEPCHDGREWQTASASVARHPGWMSLGYRWTCREMAAQPARVGL